MNEHSRFAKHILPKKPTDLNWNETLEVLQLLFGQKKSLFRRRFECFRLEFPPNSDVDAFANTLNASCEDAQMNNIDARTIKCLAFVFAFRDPQLADYRVRLLRKLDQDQNATLNDLVAEYHLLKSVKEDSRLVENAEHAVNMVKKHKYRRGRKQPPLCSNCSQKHWKQPCSSLNISGSYQKESNAAKFKSKTRQKEHRQPGDQRNGRISLINNGMKSKSYLDIDIAGTNVRLQLDTGADATLISRATWMALGSPHLEPCRRSFKAANDQSLEVDGWFKADFTVKDCDGRAHTGYGKCYVSANSDLLGMTWIRQLPDFNHLISRYEVKSVDEVSYAEIQQSITDQLKTKYADVFEEGLGRCKKTKAVLQLKPDAVPIFRKKRPVLYAVIEKLDNEIDRLLQSGAISAVDHSMWAAPIVVVKKSNGSIRLCADFSTGLNDALMLHQHPLPTADDVFTKLNGGTIFSKIDFSDAYLQVEMDETSKELLTTNTHRGLFRYNRLPFGVKSAPGIFQQIIDSMIAGLNGVAAYLDDVLVTGRTIEEHNANLEALFKRILNYGFRVRLEKCNFASPQLTYLGHVISTSGRRPDLNKIGAILKMPDPKNIAQFRSFLGMLNYYGSFVQEMRHLRAPMDALLKKDAPFVWSAECQQAFNRAKEVLNSDLLLTHFNPEYPIIVAADASDNGIGAVISHRFKDGSEKAVYHASRSLNDAEKNYSQIEKEGLALIFAIRKFHRFIYGRRFTLLTDHKPLLSIFGSKKGIPIYTANRLQRWSLTLLAYDFKIEYRSTTSFGQADALSRLIAAQQTASEEDVVIAKVEEEVREIYINAVKSLPVTADEVAEQTKRDPVLKAVLQMASTGAWPAKPTPEISRFSMIRHGLAIQDNCIFFGSRVVIPSILQQRVLKTLHDGHPGINRMKALAREFVYWTNIDKDIEVMVKCCAACQENAKLPLKHHLKSWTTPAGPWIRIHVDFAGPFNGKTYFIVVDAYSKWPEIVEMKTVTSTSTILELRRLFAQFGYPETMVSDNGPQFTSTEFEQFCREDGINHVRSAPYHPQSNGQAERFVDTFKRTMRKLLENGSSQEALQTFLFTYRHTPCSSSPEGRSPAENFLGRRLRTTLSMLKNSTEQHHDCNSKMELQFNQRHGTKARSFKVGDLVYAVDKRHGHGQLVPAEVKLKIGNVMYEVLANNQIWKRHINQLRRRFTDSTETVPDTFDLPLLPPRMPTDDDQSTATAVPLRRSTRARQPPTRLVVNPTKKTYTELRSTQKGGVAPSK